MAESIDTRMMFPSLTGLNLADVLIALYEHDQASNDKTYNVELRQSAIEAFKKLPVEEGKVWPIWLVHFVRDRFLSDEGLDEGYGIEDVVEFVSWLEFEV